MPTEAPSLRAILLLTLSATACVGPFQDEGQLPPRMGGGEASCGEARPKPIDEADACYWLPPFGSVVTATVLDIGSSVLPYEDGSCLGVNRSLVVQLRIDETLWGEETPEVIDLNVGVDQYGNWSPTPLLSADGAIGWTPPVEGRGPLRVGQRLGLHVDRPPGREFFVSGASLEVSDGGGVNLIPGPCDFVLDAYESLDALKSELALCPVVDGAFLPETVGWATCYEEHPPDPQPRCTEDSHCTFVDGTCVDGTCAPSR